MVIIPIQAVWEMERADAREGLSISVRVCSDESAMPVLEPFSKYPQNVNRDRVSTS
jgi:hypothetical protein